MRVERLRGEGQNFSQHPAFIRAHPSSTYNTCRQAHGNLHSNLASCVVQRDTKMDVLFSDNGLAYFCCWGMCQIARPTFEALLMHICDNHEEVNGAGGSGAEELAFYLFPP